MRALRQRARQLTGRRSQAFEPPLRLLDPHWERHDVVGGVAEIPAHELPKVNSASVGTWLARGAENTGK
jgi:hypothetical protein